MATTIGVRELQQHASRWLDEVEGGESLVVTRRGRPVARLLPILDEELSGWDALVAEGAVEFAPRPGRPLPPLVALPPGGPTTAEILDELRADRF